MQRHFRELYIRGMHSLVVLGAVFLVCFYFANSLYNFVAIPLLEKLPTGTTLIATQITAPFMVPMQLSFLFAVLICLPYLLYQAWGFIKPGLYKQERQRIAPLVIYSCLLFYLGIAFAWSIICPVALNFFINCAPSGVKVMFDIGSYLDFIITIAFATGLAFQIPIITRILIRSGLMTKQQLTAKRKHVIVLALVLGMILAPPDLVSHLLLAIPMWSLFELGLLTTR